MKKLWKWLLIILIIVVAIFLPNIIVGLGSWLQSLGWTGALASAEAFAASLPMWAGAVTGLGLAFLIDPETTGEIVTDLVEAAVSVGEAVVDGATSLAGSLLSSPLGLGLLAAGFWFFFMRDKERPSDPLVLERGTTQALPEPLGAPS